MPTAPWRLDERRTGGPHSPLPWELGDLELGYSGVGHIFKSEGFVSGQVLVETLRTLIMREQIGILQMLRGGDS
jgi:hypothetical protein